MRKLRSSTVATSTISSTATTPTNPVVKSRRSIKLERSTTPKEATPESLYPYRVINEIPVSDTTPDISKLKEPLTVEQSHVLRHSLEQSRNVWLSGELFEKFWTRPPRGRKLATGEVNAREKMTKLCECSMIIGPHLFEVKLFIVKDESNDVKQLAQEDLRMEEMQRQQMAQQPITQHQNVTPVKQEPSEEKEMEQSPQQSTSILPRPEPESTEKDPVQASPTKEVTSPSCSSAQPLESSLQKTSSAPLRPIAPSPGTPVADGRPPSPTLHEPITSANNQAIIAKLQAMARVDSILSSLMKIVATGNASNTQILDFQQYIARARAMQLPPTHHLSSTATDNNGNNANNNNMKNNNSITTTTTTTTNAAMPKKIAKPSPKQPKKPKQQYTPRKLLKNVMIVFEFKDNPTDRYILPKESIVEVLPSGNVLLSFMVFHKSLDGKNKKQESKSSKKQQSENRPEKSTIDATQSSEVHPIKDQIPKKEVIDTSPRLFSSLTMIIKDCPMRCIPMIERSVIRKDIVYSRMEVIIKNGVRATDWRIWYQVEKADSELLEILKKPAKLPLNMYAPARKREYKPRKKADGETPAKKHKKSEDEAKKKKDSNETNQQMEEGDVPEKVTVSAVPESPDKNGSSKGETGQSTEVGQESPDNKQQPGLPTYPDEEPSTGNDESVHKDGEPSEALMSDATATDSQS